MNIKNWYGIAATGMGEKLLRHLGFNRIEGKREAYLLEDIEISTGLIKDFLKKVENVDSDLPPLHGTE